MRRGRTGQNPVARRNATGFASSDFRWPSCPPCRHIGSGPHLQARRRRHRWKAGLFPFGHGRSEERPSWRRVGCQRTFSAITCTAAQRPRAQLPGGSGNGPFILAHSGGQDTANFPHASRVSCSERLCENPEFANRVPTSTPRAWGAHADRPHFLLPSMPFLGLAPHRPEFSHSLAS